jgi:hypothetical protein
MMRLPICVLVLVLVLAFAGKASAVVPIVGRVTVVESTYMPGEISFMLDVGSPTCPAGTWLFWRKDVENTKATYALLLTAVSTGRKVVFYHADGACTGAHMHLLAQ